MNKTRVVAATVAGLSLSAAASAQTLPFTEGFNSPAANWSSDAVFTPLNYLPAGGVGGSAYGSRSVSFAGNVAGDQPLLFRGQSNFSSSGNGFVGNWISSGVTAFTFNVRHNAPAPVDFYARFAPAAGPGAVALVAPALSPNTWQSFTIPINPATPFIYEGTTFNVFSSIARVQVGALVTPALAGQAGPFTFDIDEVGIVPAPATASLLLGALAVGARRRRR